jgi:hypothetical protein
MIYLFVLIATATLEPASGRIPIQTIGYYATASECQLALLNSEKTMDRTYVRLDCLPIRGTDN